MFFSVALDKGKVSQVDKQMVIDDKTKQSTQEVLFDFIAKSVAEFVQEHKIISKLPLGFTFSFPVRQTSLIKGTLIRWTKDFTASGAEGEDVVKLLRDAFVRRGVSMWAGMLSSGGGECVVRDAFIRRCGHQVQKHMAWCVESLDLRIAKY